MDNSAPVMSETEDDDSQMSKKDVSLFSHHRSINTRQLHTSILVIVQLFVVVIALYSLWLFRGKITDSAYLSHILFINGHMCCCENRT